MLKMQLFSVFLRYYNSACTEIKCMEWVNEELSFLQSIASSFRNLNYNLYTETLHK